MKMARLFHHGVLVREVVMSQSVKTVTRNTEWPIWAKALKQFAKPEDKGIGDVVARIIGEEKSSAFSAWYLAMFGKPCNCKGRQARWNKLYPLNQ